MTVANLAPSAYAGIWTARSKDVNSSREGEGEGGEKWFLGVVHVPFGGLVKVGRDCVHEERIVAGVPDAFERGLLRLEIELHNEIVEARVEFLACAMGA